MRTSVLFHLLLAKCLRTQTNMHKLQPCDETLYIVSSAIKSIQSIPISFCELAVDFVHVAYFWRTSMRALNRDHTIHRICAQGQNINLQASDKNVEWKHRRFMKWKKMIEKKVLHRKHYSVFKQD